MTIDIDNHITSSGSYYRFQKWLEELSNHKESLPEELFNISSQMQEIVNKKLHVYLAEILNLLSEERSSSTNIIDSSIASTMTNTTNMKICLGCEKHVEAKNSTIDQLNNPYIFKSYNINEEQINMFTPKISLTQQKITNSRVNIPKIYIPNPTNINPNSLANIERFLNIDLKCFAVCQGYRTENQLFYLKDVLTIDASEINFTNFTNSPPISPIMVKLFHHISPHFTSIYSADHHKSWDSICNISLSYGYEAFMAICKKLF
ncbi:hypothetical protein F8M41_013416 [Gigaspora margarita]|uniref:Uncharacterized protein n=1 Tax=Gigaspora margarita TaxID=4874 RepID=A0A8H3WYF1_GIGMA|nr:hypothetical protein F8M41_013416 [Gigaspora margarita]